MTVKVRTSARGIKELWVVDEPWRPELADRFHAEACTGLLTGCPASAKCLLDLNFVTGLSGLRSVRLLRGAGDCLALFDILALEELSFPTDFRGPLLFSEKSGLKVLETPAVTGIHTVSALRALQELTVSNWADADLTFLGEKPVLKSLRIETKRRHHLSCVGVAAASNLVNLSFYEARLSDVDELAGLAQLHKLTFRNAKIDSLGFVQSLLRLKSLELDNCGAIHSLSPLDRHATIESIAISGSTTFTDGDLSPLLRLPRLREIGFEKGASHYSHSPAEIRQAVRAGTAGGR